MAKKKINVGRSMLETITVALYENPIILFREYVQNSLDAHNREVDAGQPVLKDLNVAITIDEAARRIVIKDNGYGIESNKKFEERIALTIGSSHQLADKTKYIGFRGIGRISGLPFCRELKFRNKAAGNSTIQECTWHGEKYRERLSDETGAGDLSSILNDIVTLNEKDAPAQEKGKHYFEVVLEGYTDDIQETLDDTNFQMKLTQMLPLQYDRRFTKAKTILRRYQAFMNEDLRRFMIPVKLRNETLCKAYDDSWVLDSDIIFWEIRGKQKKDQSLGDKIGLLWFTFSAHLKAHGNDQYYGILTRSKNVLMGGNDTFAQVADSSSTYVTTFREMAQALRGVYGELLINSQHLSDNSRRDWFLPDEHSRDLNNVITDFMKRLNEYRYCSSRYFRKEPTKSKEELKTALDELVDLKAHSINFAQFSRRTEEPATPEQPSTDSLADEDIPHASPTMKRNYDALIKVIEAYFRKIKKRDLFLELRAFIAKHLEQK